MENTRFEMFSPTVLQLAKAIHALKNRKLAEHGLKGANTICLCRLLESGEEGLTATQLAHSCDIDKAQISRCMAELTEKRYVYRHDMDGRRYKQKYHLTEEGRAVALDIVTTAQGVHQTLHKGIKDEELEQFFGTLGKLCENLSLLLEDEQ